MLWFFLFFIVSGFCSILYELVWLRLSMAAFGVTTALTSIVLSVFMTGLGLGSWGSGRLIRRYQERLPLSPLFLYAAIELFIGVSALLVPTELQWGRAITGHLSGTSSFAYYFSSGLCVTAALLPWTSLMGATIPVGMLAIARTGKAESKRTFSYLYLANVTGALVGTIVPLLLIELRGFHGTLRTGAALNFALAVCAAGLAFAWRKTTSPATSAIADATSQDALPADAKSSRNILLLLFGTGLTSMGMELVWIRQFTPYLGTVVYAFAAILGVYLGATSIGAAIYRRWSRSHSQELGWVWGLLGLCGLLPLFAVNPSVTWWPSPPTLYGDPQISIWPFLRLVVGIAPFSGVLGFLTPMLVDRWSGGDPERVGSAYAVNVLGCIAGPLVSGFLLLPVLDERIVLFLLALPWLWRAIKSARAQGQSARTPVVAWSYATMVGGLVLLATSHGFEDQFQSPKVLRDHTATVIAANSRTGKRLLVNGVGMTALTPITKMMAHLSMASLDRKPQNALIICFGMGTTFRSFLSWGVPATAVELVPSVPRLFPFFHPDAPALLQSPNAHVVIDDGRRYLERTTEQYDVIAIDPPPPIEAAGSSLLYTKEFYTTIRRRLKPGGILQQWFPEDKKDTVVSAVAKSLQESFPHVRSFPSMYGWGIHFLASDQPIPQRSPEELVTRMPATAVDDLMEWGPYRDPLTQFASVVGREIPMESLIARVPDAPAMEDDRPVNEYYLLRSTNWIGGSTPKAKEMGAVVPETNPAQK